MRLENQSSLLSLDNLELAPPQVWGNIRLVPVLRQQTPGDLRIHPCLYEDEAAIALLEAELYGGRNHGLKHISYMPYGCVVRWNTNSELMTTTHTLFLNKSSRKDERLISKVGVPIRGLHRMVKRTQGTKEIRLLPLHVAMEGFLMTHFNAPEIAWAEYSRRAISRGLSPRTETSVHGASLYGFDEALRVFEIHEQQVGVLVFIADAFASAFIVSHPIDYRLLHTSLLEDFYGELFYHYSYLVPELAPAYATINAQSIRTTNDMRAALRSMRNDWAEFTKNLTQGIVNIPLRRQRIYQMDTFGLERFTTSFKPHEENHIGEVITNKDGTIEYLKTFRLSDAQVRRAYLLEQLSQNDWNVAQTANALKTTKEELFRRISNNGLEVLFKPHLYSSTTRKD